MTQVALAPDGVSAKAISENLRLSRPTVYNLLRTLVHEGCLARGSDGRYRFGLRIGTFSEAFSRQLAPGDLLATIVRELARETEEAAYVAVRRELDVLLVIAEESRHAIGPYTPALGVMSDIHARASGKVALAYAPPEVRALFFQTRKLTRFTAATLTTPETLEREFERIRKQGFATNVEEQAPGLCAIAAPIDAGISPFVIALSIPRDRYEKSSPRYLDALLRAAGRASSASLQRPSAMMHPSSDDLG